MMDAICNSSLERIIQESVPGKQVTIAHVIAAPDAELYDRLGLEPQEALGILTLTPTETAIIAADIATKAAEVEIGFLDRFTGSITITGDVQSVEVALQAVTETLSSQLGFAIAKVTRT
jgi:ethanolamine utilization protein EutS